MLGERSQIICELIGLRKIKKNPSRLIEFVHSSTAITLEYKKDKGKIIKWFPNFMGNRVGGPFKFI